jgi:hypothetical protein
MRLPTKPAYKRALVIVDLGGSCRVSIVSY